MVKHEISVKVAKNTDSEFKIDKIARRAGSFMKGLIEYYPNLINKKNISGIEEDEILYVTVYFDVDNMQTAEQKKAAESLQQPETIQKKPL